MTSIRTIGAAGIGAALMYLFDPDRGQRRRARVRDQMMSAAHKTGDSVVAEFRNRLAAVPVSDAVLAQRVRSRLEAVVGYASSIQSTVLDGHVTLIGPVFSGDVERLLRRVRAVRGVKDVDSRLEIHEEPGNIPALQGVWHSRPGGQVFELMPNNWSPGTRIVTGFAGGTLLVWGLRRLDEVGVTMLIVGLALLSRGITNVPMTWVAEGSGVSADVL